MRFLAWLLLPITLVVTGCGFHLRGMIDADSIRWLNSVTIVIQEAHRDLEPLLRNQLKAYDIQVTTDPRLAQYWLILEKEDLQQNLSSVSSSTTPRQYELIYTLNFKLQRAKGAEIIPSNQIVVTRQITLNSDRILGSKDEEDLQRTEMRKDAVIQILNRLSRAAPKSNAPQNTVIHANYVN